MNIRSRSARITAATAVAALGASLAVTLTSGPSAQAGAALPWLSAANKDPHDVGSLTLRDTATGAAVTSGTLGAFPAYAVGSAVSHTGDTAASLFAYSPNSQPFTVDGTSEALPAGAWSGGQLTAAQSFTGSTPTVALAGGTSLEQYVVGFPTGSDATAAYQNVYELRLRTTSASGALSDDYDAVDLLVTGTGDDATWQVVTESSDGTGSNPVSTTTTIAATPTSLTAGGAVKLTATIAPAAAQGTVQFMDNGAVLGTPVQVSGGSATTTVKPAKGTHSYTATFTSSQASAYSGSSSMTAAAVTVSAAGTVKPGGGSTVKPPAPVVKVAAAIKVKIAKKVKHTKKAKITVTVTAPGVVPTGTVTIFDGKKTLGTLALVDGKATKKLKKLKKGKHKIKVTYAGSTRVDAATSKTTKVTSK